MENFGQIVPRECGRVSGLPHAGTGHLALGKVAGTARLPFWLNYMRLPS